MNKNAKLWVNSLRSGNYPQGVGRLGNPEKGLCCLGVGCAVYEEETGDNLPKTSSGDYAGLTLKGFDVVREWLGLASEQGNFTAKEHIPGLSYSQLTQLNDEVQWDFEQIADLIESEPEGLFVD